MAALGDKIGSTILAQSAGVPTLPWSGTGVLPPPAALAAEATSIPPAVYQRACVASLDECLAACGRIGYPCMIKASWGGGGKGIRKVLNDEEVRRVFQQVQVRRAGGGTCGKSLCTFRKRFCVQHSEQSNC